MKAIKVTAQYGHEIMALNFAKVFGVPGLILPKTKEEGEFTKKSEEILANLSFFSNNLHTVDFGRREMQVRDIIGELKEGTLDSRLWNKFAESRLEPQGANLPEYAGLKGKTNVLVVPQKLVSDGECGVTAQQQSLPLEVFDFLKGSPKHLVLGQHFDKKSDLPIIQKLAKEFGMYVPGMTENEHVFGIRGVQHKEYYNMYNSLAGAVGIAGTHTWILLTTFPWIPQVILFNRNGVERWEDIEKAYQAQGYKIYALGFDEKTDMQEFSKRVSEACDRIF